MPAPQEKDTKPTTEPRTLPAANLEAIRLLKQWAKEPPEQDEAFWSDFEKELAEQRVHIG